MRFLHACLLPLLIALAVPSASAQETTLANDSTRNGVPSVAGATLTSFLPGEVMAAWLTASCSGDVVAAQVYFASQFGGQPATLEQSISILAPGGFPIAGAPLLNQGGVNAVIVAPSLQDGVMNSFRFLDPPSDSVPLRVPVVAGQRFVVALQFQNQLGPSPFALGPTWDTDGCQPGLNAYDPTPGSWVDACALGVTGDFVVRAVVRCAPPVPALGGLARQALLACLLLLGAAVLACSRPRR